jgi:hypothetical protein
MSNIEKISKFDSANLDLARRVQARPDRYQAHLHLWAERVIQRLGSDEERVQLEAQASLFEAIGTPEDVEATRA